LAPIGHPGSQHFLISHRSATGKDETQSSAPIPNSRLLPAGTCPHTTHVRELTSQTT
jgi:hypothetical protein